MKNTGQASLEYMVMLGVSLLIFAAIIAYSINMLGNVRSQLSVDSAYKAVEEIKEASDFIYVHGHPSKIRRNIRIPGNIENITVDGSLVKLRISSTNSFTDIYDITKGNMTATDALGFICQVSGGSIVCREGNYILNFESMESGYTVNITAG